MRDELTAIVDRCRDQLRLVTISRSDPPLPTKRWLAEGRAVELRMDTLAFRADEAVALMHRFDVDALDDADVERLNGHVEGWVVGLLLSGLTLEGRPDLATSLDDLIHSDRHLTDYLVDEVLDRLPEDLRDLALMLSVPSSFDEELAQRLTGRADAGALLERLVRSNPFVVAIASPPAYRFHHLVRSLLSSTFRWTDRRGFERAHREGRNDDRAWPHRRCDRLAAGDRCRRRGIRPGRRADLQTTDQGRVRELAQWLEMLGDVAAGGPVRALDYALALVLAGRLEHAHRGDRPRCRARRPDRPAVPHHARDAMHLTALAPPVRSRRPPRSSPCSTTSEGDVRDSRHIDSRLSSQAARVALAVGDLERAERWLRTCPTP
jgi:LuxR family transcriptional regulator, maltose regulon positive regulatory protein